jgi:AraC family transcriptional regulator of adaptative response/methylated-DNA-[protein]-cysteine methyltransferase
MMLNQLPSQDRMYRALVERDGAFEGVFVVGVRTTGIFCRPTCPARKPHAENVDFYLGAREALSAGFRPCKRCKPMEPKGQAPGWLDGLLAAVDADPARRWHDQDLRARDLEPARVRRWFNDHHGMTFHAYQRSRRLGAALGQIRHGLDLTQAAFEAGYESPSAFVKPSANSSATRPGERARSDCSRSPAYSRPSAPCSAPQMIRVSHCWNLRTVVCWRYNCVSCADDWTV